MSESDLVSEIYNLMQKYCVDENRRPYITPQVAQEISASVSSYREALKTYAHSSGSQFALEGGAARAHKNNLVTAPPALAPKLQK